MGRAAAGSGASRRARRMSTRAVVLATVAGLLVLGVGIGGVLGAVGRPQAGPPGGSATFGPSLSATPATEAPPATEAAPATADQTALLVAGLLEVKGRAPKTGYDRDLFGSGWVDVNRNGCDTRNDMLARDLTATAFKPGTRDCVVLRGRLADPYSGTTIDFLRGIGTSEEVQIDHVVPLSDAWQKGAQQWDAAKRVDFANAPLNLLAVDGPLNGQKSDGDTATWLPPNKAFRCQYVARQVAVKQRYGLWVTVAEQAAMVRVLSTCPSEPLPGDLVAVQAPTPTTAAPVPLVARAPEPAPAPAQAPAPAPAAPSDVYYKNCDAARAAGAAPVRIGQPGYRPALDGDGDGIGCE